MNANKDDVQIIYRPLKPSHKISFKVKFSDIDGLINLLLKAKREFETGISDDQRDRLNRAIRRSVKNG